MAGAERARPSVSGAPRPRPAKTALPRSFQIDSLRGVCCSHGVNRALRPTREVVVNKLKNISKLIDPRWKDVPARLPARQNKRVHSISYATGGMLTRGNIDALYHALRETRHLEGSLIEIGSYCGLSSNVITYLKRHLEIEKPLFAIDPWDLAAEAEEAGTTGDHIVKQDLGISLTDLGVFIREAYKSRVGFFSAQDLPHALRGYSNDVMATWRAGGSMTDQFGREVVLGGPIAFAYIDGDHTYQGARDDFENVDRHLVKGGMILFDDSGDGGDRGCERAAREASRHPEYELVSKNPNYLIRKKQ